MSVEVPRGESRENDQLFEIKLDVPFKPYAGIRKRYWPKKGENPAIVHEDYDHVLLLRRKVSLYGIKGWIDVISDDPFSFLETAGFPIEKPLGEANFVGIYRGGPGPADYTWRERAYILRFGFHLCKPADYAKLLNTWVDVVLGRKRYMTDWNLNIPRVQRVMKRLEEGKEVILPEKNLINFKRMDKINNDVDAKNEDFERVSVVLLPEDLEKLRTIELTFRQIFDKGHEEQPTPTRPHGERILVRI